MATEVLIKRLLGSSLLLVEIEWLLYRLLLEDDRGLSSTWSGFAKFTRCVRAWTMVLLGGFWTLNHP
ncbi:hypothetical protein D5086_014596 [Populus alba]|uniref:Uncharacterized protein n=1 Tax=Populus alba TaxID=43335 RepID=A0ACC4BY51_POPAL